MAKFQSNKGLNTKMAYTMLFYFVQETWVGYIDQ